MCYSRLANILGLLRACKLELEDNTQVENLYTKLDLTMKMIYEYIFRQQRT